MDLPWRIYLQNFRAPCLSPHPDANDRLTHRQRNSFFMDIDISYTAYTYKLQKVRYQNCKHWGGGTICNAESIELSCGLDCFYVYIHNFIATYICLLINLLFTCLIFLFLMPQNCIK